MHHLISLEEWSPTTIKKTIGLAKDIKRRPERYDETMNGRILAMLFEKPSLRTRVSFEAGTAQMGGHAIYYDLSTSPLASGKENIGDTIKVLSRYADLVMARLFRHEDLLAMARHTEVPVINALTNFNHPCQVLADLMTIREHKGHLEGLILAYCGDANNNVTHSLLYGCSKTGMHLRIACPEAENYCPLPEVMKSARDTASKTGGSVSIGNDPDAAVTGADIVYTDSWMSYHIDSEQREQRIADLKPFQVTARLMHKAPEAIFMNCLPAQRGYEQTAEVIDGPQSVVFDEAENRLHVQKAIMLRLMGFHGGRE